jgi:hypothetical protein
LVAAEPNTYAWREFGTAYRGAAGLGKTPTDERRIELLPAYCHRLKNTCSGRSFRSKVTYAADAAPAPRPEIDIAISH